MKIIVGKLSGFCHGVKSAVEGAEKLVGKKKIYCVGEIAHNRQVVGSLENNGLITVDKIEEVPEGADVIFRAHGMPKSAYKYAKNKKMILHDLTCTGVKMVHGKVKAKSKEGKFIILYGDINHPEIIGTKSFTSEDNIYVLQSEEEIDGAVEAIEASGKDVYIAAQTTFSLKKFDELTNIIKNRCNDKEIKVEIGNTICSATEKRQKETEKISQNVDYMIIIGGKNSANTKKLFEISKRNCKNYIHIQTKDDLDGIDFTKYNKVGVVAGSSTPKKSINDLVEYLKSL